MRDPLSYRPEFPILSRAVYMISNSLGAMPRGVAASLAEYADTWATRGVRAWTERWWTMGTEVGDAIGRIIGAPTGSVSMHENVTTAHAVALSSLPLPGHRRRLVCCEGDFPSTIYLLRAQETLGFELTIVPAEADFSVDVQKVVDAIDGRTAMVAVSHVLFRSSFILDPQPIIERAHAVGAQVILDTYQSAGIVPVDVSDLGVDFATGGCLKWLCGGPGNAFLYTRPDLLGHVRPRLTGWFSHQEPFAFDTGAFEPHADARRMMNGTPSIPAWYAALPGLRLLEEVGIGAVRARSQALTARLLAGCRSARLPDDRASRSGAAGGHGRHRRPGRTARRPHPQRPRLRRRLPRRRRHPRIPALLQHRGGDRSADHGAGGHRAHRELR